MSKGSKYFNGCASGKCPEAPAGLLRNRGLGTPPQANIKLNRDFQMKKMQRCQSACQSGGGGQSGSGKIGLGRHGSMLSPGSSLLSG